MGVGAGGDGGGDVRPGEASAASHPPVRGC